MTEEKKFITNNLFVISTRTISKIITLILFLFLARLLSVENFGKLVLLTTTTSILSYILDLGTSTFLVREIAAKNQIRFFVLRSVLTIKSLFAIPIMFFFFLIIYLFQIESITNIIIFFLGIGIVFESLLLTMIKQFEGMEQINLSSILLLIERLLIFLFFFITIPFENVILRYSVSYFLSNFFTFIITIIVTRIYRIIKINLNFFKFSQLKYILNYSFFFFLFGLCSIIYTRSDIFLLERFTGNINLGFYRASYQVIEAIYFIPMSLSVTLLPTLTRYYKRNKALYEEFFSFILINIIFFSLLILLIFYFHSDFIIKILYSEKYFKSVNLLKIMSFTIPLYFINTILGNSLIAMHKEKIQFLSMLIGTVIKLLFLIFFIPKMEIIGASFCLIFGEFCVLIIQMWGNKNIKIKTSVINLFLYFFIIIIIILNEVYINNLFFLSFIYIITIIISFVLILKRFKLLYVSTN